MRRDKGHQGAGHSAGEGGEEDEARGDREDSPCYERADDPGEWAGDPAVVLEEVVAERKRDQRSEDDADGECLDRQRA